MLCTSFIFSSNLNCVRFCSANGDELEKNSFFFCLNDFALFFSLRLESTMRISRNMAGPLLIELVDDDLLKLANHLKSQCNADDLIQCCFTAKKTEQTKIISSNIRFEEGTAKKKNRIFCYNQQAIYNTEE